MPDAGDGRTVAHRRTVVLAVVCSVLAVACALFALAAALIAGSVLLFDDGPQHPGRHWAAVWGVLAVVAWVVMAALVAGAVVLWRRCGRGRRPLRRPSTALTEPPTARRH